MEFIIPADTYLRLATVALQPDETNENYDEGLRSVRIEHKNDYAIAVASCGSILAAELIGPAHHEDEAMNVSIDPKLIELAKEELEHNGAIHINRQPGWSIAKGTHGKMCPINAEVTGEFPDWRTVVPNELPSKHNGFHMFGAGKIGRLAASAPSQAFVIQRYADIRHPVIVRDLADSRWMGMFLITSRKHTVQPDAVEIPEWVR